MVTLRIYIPQREDEQVMIPLESHAVVAAKLG